MCGRYRNFVKITLSMCLCLLLSSFSCLGVGAYTPPTEQSTTITMSMTQYNRLKTIIEAQDNRLTQLQSKLNLLKSNSMTASNELTESQTELKALRSELITTQKSLESARISLAQAEETLQRQEASLQTLTEQIQKIEHKATVLRRQRDIYAGLLALSLGGVIARR